MMVLGRIKERIVRVYKPMKTTLSYLFRRPVTVMYPREPAVVKERWRGEHVLLWDKCIGCGLCALACPNKTIEYVYTDPKMDPRDRKNNKFRRPAIDWAHCIWCGLCVEACPTNALRFVPNYKKMALADSKLDLIVTPEEIAVEEGKKKQYENPLDKIRRLLVTNLISKSLGHPWEEIARGYEEEWRKLYYDFLEGKIGEEEWNKKAREIEEKVLKLMEAVSIP